MLASVLIVVALLVVMLLVVVALRPAAFRIERSRVITASPQTLFEQIDDLHQWHQWSPWARRDPAMQVDYVGATRGPGAEYHWSGNREVGKGSMIISDSRPGELVRMQLEFLEPFRASNIAEFALRPETGGTRVVWSMSGRNGFVGKLMGLVFDMDTMLGKDFDQGLAALKARAEGAPGGP